MIEPKAQPRRNVGSAAGSPVDVRLSELTLKRLWSRQRLTDGFLHEVEEWLWTAGWALLFSGETYAAIKIQAVRSWPRITSKQTSQEFSSVEVGSFDFSSLERLLGSNYEESEDGGQE